MIARQNSFLAGLDYLTTDTQVSEDGYVWLINGRNRFGTVAPIRKSVELSLPDGNKQGITSIGNTLIAFVDGEAYYQIDGDTVWIKLPDLLLDSSVELIYTESVPASTTSFVRKLASSGNIKDPIVLGADFRILGTPTCLVCQDGINQPWLIFFDDTTGIFVTRTAGTFDSWQNVAADAADREYVPIGRQMMYKDGKLYIVAPNKKSCYQSIIGRPLDFMINVDTNGNKMPSEAEGGAATVSFAFDFDDITCIRPIDVADSFIYATAKTTRIITLDYTNTIFGEPTFKCAGTMEVGVVNQFCMAQVGSSIVSIEKSGLKSFNAVQQLRFRGNNSIFSLNIAKLLYNRSLKRAIKQRNCSLVYYDNYIICNLDTYWGNLIAVYDQIQSCWTSLDITEVNQVKQFAILETEESLKLYCVTKTGKAYQLYASSSTETAMLRVRAFLPASSDTEHKSMFVHCMFEGGTFDGKTELIEYVDNQESSNTRTIKDLKVALGGVVYPVRAPVIPSTEQRTENISFPLVNGLTGRRITFILKWTNDAELIEYQISTSETQSMNSQREQNLVYKNTYGS